jgi:chromosome segregation ATPase
MTATCDVCFSGGERSFTTVAFILALGKWTESPFRAMDEYDVFMDAVNRRIATQTLLEFALEEDGLQFVLLTPQVRNFFCSFCVRGSIMIAQ